MAIPDRSPWVFIKPLHIPLGVVFQGGNDRNRCTIFVGPFQKLGGRLIEFFLFVDQRVIDIADDNFDRVYTAWNIRDRFKNFS